jgi:thiol-disulfide isomerase/thioredoxin
VLEKAKTRNSTGIRPYHYSITPPLHYSSRLSHKEKTLKAPSGGNSKTDPQGLVFLLVNVGHVSNSFTKGAKGEMNVKSGYLRGFLWVTIFILLQSLTACNMGSSYDFPDWEHGASGHSNALSWAEDEGLPLIVYFHTDWCGWCKKLDAEYLATAQMQEFLEGIPKVEINPDKGAAEKALAERKYRVTGYPYLVVYLPAYESEPYRLHPFRRNGHLSVDQFIRNIEERIAYEYDGRG